MVPAFGQTGASNSDPTIVRAARSEELVQLWAEEGRRAEAYDLLAPVLGWLTGGFDTVDLTGAEALLDELR